MTARTVAQNAELALLLELAGTPKPGNVDREREYPDLRFEHFLAGAVGARPGLDAAAAGDCLGDAFETAVAGMAQQSAGNTQFGALLLQLPLVVAASGDHLTPDGATAVAEATTVADAAGFYRAFEHVDVAVADPPPGLEPLDVRRGSDAVPTLEARGLTLADVMAESAEVDGIAAEWVGGFDRTFGASASLLAGSGPVADRAADVFLELLAAEPDTFVVTRQDEATAREVQQRARAVLDGDADATDMAEDLVARDVNPGTTADIVAGALFVALERGLEI